MTTLLSPEPVLWAPEMTCVFILADGTTRSKATYQGHRQINDEVGVGHFYPQDYHVRKVWMRRDLRPGRGGECGHLACSPEHPEATAYWEVDWRPTPKEWRDGAWRKTA